MSHCSGDPTPSPAVTYCTRRGSRSFIISEQRAGLAGLPGLGAPGRPEPGRQPPPSAKREEVFLRGRQAAGAQESSAHCLL